MAENEVQKKDFTHSRAKAAVLSRDFDLAARLYKGILKNDPDNVEILHELGAMYTRSQQDERALTIYEQILSLKADDFVALTSLGGIYRRLNRYEESIEALDRALTINPDDVQVHYNLGFTYKLMGMYQDALECFNTVIDSNPNDILAYNQLGSIHSLLGERNEAILTYRRGLHLDPNHPVLHFNLAKELEFLGRDEEVKLEYEAALRAKPGWSDALNGYALFLMSHNKNTEAYEILQRGIKVSPEDSMLQNSMGTLQFKRGDYAEAENSFRSVLNRDSEDFDALIGLADVYIREEKHENANSIFQRIKQKPPKAEAKQIRYARSLLNASKINEGGNIIKQLWNTDHGNVEVMRLIAEYYTCRNDMARLRTVLKQIAIKNADYYRHYLNIAERFYQNGNIAEAITYLQQFLEHRPNDMEGISLLASCYETMNKHQEALALYQKALSSDKDSLLLKKAVARNEQITGGISAEVSRKLGDVLLNENINSLQENQPLDTLQEEEIPSQDEFSFDELDFEEPSVQLASDSNFDDALTMQIEPETEEDEMIFNLDNMSEAFVEDDVFDPLELEPIDLEPLEESERLEALTYDGSPMDYEPNIENSSLPEQEDLSPGFDFEDEELELGSEIEDEVMPTMQEEPEPIVPKTPSYIPPQYPIPPYTPSEVQLPKAPKQEVAATPKFEPEVEEQFESGDFSLQNDSRLDKVGELIDQLVDKDVKENCSSTIELFKHMRDMCNFLPPLQKEAFLTGKRRVQLDYIIDKMDGRPGLLASAEALRKNGIVDIPEERYDVVKEFNEAVTTGRVFSHIRELIHQLPDKDTVFALDGIATEIMERLANLSTL